MSKRRDTQYQPGPHWSEPKPAKRLIDDDRPTELFEPVVKDGLHESREQLIIGMTIAEMIRNSAHKLSAPLAQLVRQAKIDLPNAEVGPMASLKLQHDFEFDRRVGYRLTLKLFDANKQCVQVFAEVDQDGRRIRQGSMMSKLLHI